MSFAPLPRSFYARPVLDVARACLGRVLVHASKEGVTAGRIVEVEAYRGPEDLAAHSAGGRRTKRTEVMFGPPGHAYVYFIYGMHWAFNIVAATEGEPHAVLVRAIEPVDGIELMAARRGMAASQVSLTNGPGKLCRAMAIDGALYGVDLTGPTLFLSDGAPPPRIACTPRINIDYAGAWIDKPWRFTDPASRHLSARPSAGRPR